MPPDTTVAELLVDFGAVVVVVGLDVVALVAPVAVVDESEVGFDFEADAVVAEAAFAELAVLPGICEATSPPKTAALSAAPPAAIAVIRRTFRSAFDLSVAVTFCDMTSSSACTGLVCCRGIHQIAWLWQVALAPLCVLCDIGPTLCSDGSRGCMCTR